MSQVDHLKKNAASQHCEHFFKKNCGGCAYLHVPYKDQLAAKEQSITSMLQNVLRALPTRKKPDLKTILKNIVPSPSPMHYRSSAKLTLHEDKSGRKVVGLFTQGTRHVVSTSGCPANSEHVNRIVDKLFTDVNKLELKFFDHSTTSFQKNCLKYLTVRTSPGTSAEESDQSHAAVIVSHTGVDKQALIKWLEAAGLENLCVYESRLAKEDGEAITGKETKHVCGPENFPYLLIDRNFQISPASFFQANHSLAAELIACATDFRVPGDILLDLYGGFGAYSFAAKDRFKELIVVDGNTAAIKSANEHAKDQGILSVKAIADTCENFLEKKLSLETSRRVTHLIANPSRTGMSRDVLKHLTQETFPRLNELHYISCSPPTFARDALRLVESGYALTEIVPFDMFPQTDHVEIAAKFMRT
jgi:23S rRNA (uracil1939-C5)-methyltransferase